MNSYKREYSYTSILFLFRNALLSEVALAKFILVLIISSQLITTLLSRSDQIIAIAY